MRSDITSELLHGTLDKFGNSRDGEKRAVLVTLERILSLAPAIHRQYNDLHERKVKQEKRLQQKTGIHDQDMLGNRVTELPGLTAGHPFGK